MKTFTCSCYSEAISIEPFEDSVLFTIWYYGYRSPWSLHDWLKNIVRIILRKPPEVDTVILDKRTAKELASYILSLASDT